MPIDYRVDVQTPFQRAITGYQAGQQVALNRMQMEKIDAERRQTQQMQTDLYELSQNPAATARDYQQISLKYPQMSQHFKTGWGMLTAEKQRAAKDQSIKVFSALEAGKPEFAVEMLRERAQAAANSGLEQEQQAAEAMIRMVETDPNMAKTAVGMQLSSIMGKQFNRLTAPAKLRKSEILDDGTTIKIYDDRTVVESPTGEILTGQAAAEAVKRAGLSGAELAAEKARLKKKAELEEKMLAEPELEAKKEREKKLAAAAVQEGQKAYTQLQVARRGIQNIDDAVAAIDKGATTGYVSNFFPNITAATNELINARNRMGLDVISNVTFGALSEKELEVAFQTAMPTRLSPPELREWLIKKKRAQEAAAASLQDAAQFLLGGGSINEWIAIQKRQQEQREGERATPAPETPAPIAPGTPETPDIDALLQKYGGAQ